MKDQIGVCRMGMALFGAAMIGSAASAQFNFSAGVNYPVGTQPDWATAADLNGDGLPDLAVTADQGLNNDAVAILLGTGNGAFAAPYYVFLPSSSSPGSVEAGDLDGDGDNDLAVGLKDNNVVLVLLNSGSGSFAFGASSPTGIEPRGMDIDDVDNDNDLDLVVANRESNTATFLRNNGNATFAATTLIAGAEPRDAVFGDFDNDGDQDIAVTNHDDRTIRVWRNEGASYVVATTFSVGSSDRGEGMDAEDLNGDGRDDIVAASGDDEGLNGNRAIVFLANSTASFTGPSYFSTNALDTSDVTARDLDCDGDLDLATANELGNSMSLLANGGAGSFGAASILGAGANPDMVLGSDLDNDGDIDLVAVNRNSSNITVSLNTCGTSSPVCGNGICEGGESTASCPGDCPPAGPVCGNGVCESGESSATCPGDCGGGGPAGSFAFDSANYLAGIQPSSIASGDFNGDGLADLAVTADQNLNSDNVALLFATAQGGYAAPVYINLPNSSSPQGLAAGDLDGNGSIDLAVVLRDLLQVRALINNGAGVFTLGASAPTGAEPRMLDIADADNDKDLDLAVANRSGNSVSVLLNNGDATFISSTVPAGLEPRDAEFGDFNADNIMEIAVSNHDDRTIGIYTSAGGAYALATTLFVGAQDRPDGLITGDFNSDGQDDLATASGDDTPALNRAVVFLASSATSFSGPAYFAAGPGVVNSSDITAGDLDCDGDLDLAIANQTSNNVSVLPNNGSGIFGAATVMAAGSRPEQLIAADLNGDGAADLAVANRDSGNVTVLTNATGSCAPQRVVGDINGDGSVNVDDLVAVINAWGPCGKGGCPADINPAAGDGQVNVDDLLLVINNWS